MYSSTAIVFCIYYTVLKIYMLNYTCIFDFDLVCFSSGYHWISGKRCQCLSHLACTAHSLRKHPETAEHLESESAQQMQVTSDLGNEESAQRNFHQDILHEDQADRDVS